MAIQESTSPSLNVDPFKYAYFANPYERIYNEDGSYAADNTYYSITHANGAYDKLLPDGGYNIFREINETSNETKNMSASLIANLSVNILDNLSFEGLASYGYVTNASDNINGKNTYAAWRTAHLKVVQVVYLNVHTVPLLRPMLITPITIYAASSIISTPSVATII